MLEKLDLSLELKKPAYKAAIGKLRAQLRDTQLALRQADLEPAAAPGEPAPPLAEEADRVDERRDDAAADDDRCPGTDEP